MYFSQLLSPSISEALTSPGPHNPLMDSMYEAGSWVQEGLNFFFFFIRVKLEVGHYLLTIFNLKGNCELGAVKISLLTGYVQ